jgi:PhnB protein
MATINPYINFNGNAEEAFTFYRSVFGGELEEIIRFKELSSPEFPVPEKEADKLLRVALPVGGNVLLANDVPESMGSARTASRKPRGYSTVCRKEEASRCR